VMGTHHRKIYTRRMGIFVNFALYEQ
jgi:hypothetical protein